MLIFTSCEKNDDTVTTPPLESLAVDAGTDVGDLKASSRSDEPEPGCYLFNVEVGAFGQRTITFAADYQGYGTNGSIKHSWRARVCTPLCGCWDLPPNNNNMLGYQVVIPGDCVTGGGGKPQPITIEVTHCIFGDSQTGWQCETETFVIQ